MILRPFWQYYGGKWRMAPQFPQPEHSTIIEPFAGAAGYSTRYYDRRVVLIEKDPTITALWRYLIAVSPAEILRLPINIQSVDDVHGPPEARSLVGFWLNAGVSAPRREPSAWMRSGRMRSGTHVGRFWSDRVRTRIAAQVLFIRHWQIIEGDYTAAPSTKATWFIDPPYQIAGTHYRHSSRSIDYRALGSWCQARTGQLIVCENDGADWLPFLPFRVVANRKLNGSREALYYRHINAPMPA